MAFSPIENDGKRRFPMRGYERMASMSPTFSFKIMHTMLISGPAFDEFLPTAVMHVFNRHPRMRVIQVQDEFATAEVQPQVTLDQVKSQQLLRVQHIITDAGLNAWQAFAEEECGRAFDRFNEFPFFLTAWVHAAQNKTRLMLFSDHYMSDGFSGAIVLNDMLEQVTVLSRAQADDSIVYPPPELPLRPGLFNLWLDPIALVGMTTRLLIKVAGKVLLAGEVRRYKPLLPIRADQHDFSIPVIPNRTYACFGDGSPDNMKRILARCKQEQVTLTGAIVAAVVLAHHHAASVHGKTPVDDTNFKLSLDIDYNMRARVPKPLPELPVGNYISMHPIESLSKKGVDLTKARFWDVARSARDEVHGAIDHNITLSTQNVLMDQHLHTALKEG